MKQGPSTSKKGAGKKEPMPRAVSPDRVSNMGLQQVRTKAPSPMFKSQGFKAPMNAASNHKTGSQGKRK
jgi:hypothetical protein